MDRIERAAHLGRADGIYCARMGVFAPDAGAYENLRTTLPSATEVELEAFAAAFVVAAEREAARRKYR